MSEVTTMNAKTIKGLVIPFPLTGEGLIFGLIVTPALAAFILQYSEDKFTNRQMSERACRQYADEMAGGRWQHNGETIIFDRDGVLVDGYTRVCAAFVYNATFVTDVRYGVDRNAVPTIDTGRTRTLSNALKVSGEEHSSALAAGIVWAWRYATNNWDMKGRVLPSQDAIRFLDNHPGLREAVSKTKHIRNKRFTKPGILIASYYILKHAAEPDVVDKFFQSLSDGVGLNKTDAIYVLRENLILPSNDTHNGPEVLKAILHAFHIWEMGGTVRRFRLPEAMPEVANFPYSRAI
jgi:hypothetical protein